MQMCDYVCIYPYRMQVCERVVSAMGEGVVPPALVARMLKYKILKRRTQDIASREALKKVRM